MRNKNVTIYFLLSAFSLVANRPGRSSISPAAVSQGGTPTPSPRTVTWKTPPSRSLGIDSEIRYFASVLVQATLSVRRCFVLRLGLFVCKNSDSGYHFST